MFEQALQTVNTVFPACAEWFQMIITQIGFAPYYIAVISIVLVVRYLVTPLVGHHSDNINNSKKR